MKNPPKFVRGAYCAAMRIDLEEIEEGFQARSEERQCMGWKLFLLLPRILLFRGLVAKQKIFDRFAQFVQGS